MKLQIDLDRMTVRDLVALESGQFSEITRILGKFVLNGNGEYMEPEAGSEAILDISVNELMTQARNLTDTIKNAVSPTNASS